MRHLQRRFTGENRRGGSPAAGAAPELPAGLESTSPPLTAHLAGRDRPQTPVPLELGPKHSMSQDLGRARSGISPWGTDKEGLHYTLVHKSVGR